MALCLCLACRPSEDAAGPPLPVFLDPQLVAVDGTAAVDFSGGGRGALKAGKGWLPRRRKSRWQRFTQVAWSSQGPTIYFVPPRREGLELRLRCRPFTWDHAPPQILTPVLNGHALRAHPLVRGDQEVRAPLPADALADGINTVELRFAHARSFRDAGVHVDPRKRSASFEAVELVRIGDAEPASTFDPERRLVRLPAGTEIALPLPAGESRVELGAVRGGGPGSRLIVERRQSDGTAAILWRGRPDELGPVEAVAPWPSRLVVRHEAGAEEPAVVLTGSDELIVPLGGAPPPRRPHVFLYVIDTLRADALGLYGATRPTSPRLSEFARDAVTFERASSAAAWTLPSVVSMLTGLYPSRHGYTHAASKPAGEAPPRLPAILAGLDYESVAISQSWVVSTVYGFGDDFDAFYLTDALSRGTAEARDVLWFVWQTLYHREDPRRPLFVYAHTVDPHQPYEPPADARHFLRGNPGRLRDWQYQPEYFASRGMADNLREIAHMRARYDGEVLHADRQLGAFLDLLKYAGLYRDSLIVVTADHGEEFAEHGGFGHGQSLFEELLHVPLLVKLPDLRHAGARVAARVSLVDIAPTVIELAGEDPALLDLDGVSLTRPHDLAGGRRIVAETFAAPSRRTAQVAVDLKGVVMDDVKCVYSANGKDHTASEVAAFRAFDLARDPAETLALPADDEAAGRCFLALLELFDLDARLPSSDRELLSEEQRDQLRALGYLD